MRLRQAGIRVGLAAFVAATASCNACRSQTPGPDETREAVSAFHIGLAALETGQDDLARDRLERVGQLAPLEPAGLANLGLLLVRRQANDDAALMLARAAALDPRNGAIVRLQALAERRRGRTAAAIGFGRRALEIDPEDSHAAFALALDLEVAGGAANELEAQQLLEAIVGREDNLAARLEWVRLASRRGDREGARRALVPLVAAPASWPSEAQHRLDDLRRAVEAADIGPAALASVLLKNALLPEHEYQQALRAVSPPQDQGGEPLVRLVTLPNSGEGPAPPDAAMSVSVAAVADGSSGGAAFAGAVSLTGDGAPALMVAGASGVSVGGQMVTVSPARFVAAADLNFDFRTDLVVAGSAGLALFRQGEDGRYVDVTRAARLPAAIRRAAATRVWSADVDLDGDLDLLVALDNGEPAILRNNTDDTFVVEALFAGVSGARDFVWADLDGEGTPDAAMLDAAGRVHLFVNARGGKFERQAVPSRLPDGVAIAAADVSGGVGFDLLVLAADGSVSRVSAEAGGRAWTVAPVAGGNGGAPPLVAGTVRLLTGDLDNNGGTDLVLAGADATQLLLAGSAGSYAALADLVPLGARALADLNEDGTLEIVGVDVDGRAAVATLGRTKPYHWQTLRPRAATSAGDQRINSFGIGGEAEVRSGLHVQRQVITSPIVHIGLGEAVQADVVRIIWPNGVLQAEFELPEGASIHADQRLKGSCPWLFGWNGTEMAFLTDVIWRSPLGLHINAQDAAEVLMTEDRVKIPGDQLVARDGAYDLRITAELWETHFFDLISLLVIDHPAGTEVFVDERFAIPPPSLDAIATEPVQPFAMVRDDAGRDVLDVVRTRDDRHLAFAGLGSYQGITRDHAIDIDLPDDAPRAGPLWLVATGWVHPTDSSVNVAISQGAHAAPRGLSLSVEASPGVFREVRSNLGFPAGKDKTVLIDLSGVFPSGGRRRVRLSTNLEIYWDRLGWAVGRPDVQLAPRRMTLEAADLRYRGYSVTTQPDSSTPERPRYELAGTAPRWRDLEGFYTRFGDVRPLLTGVDDRYVILNAGDELGMRFEEASPPVPGFVRDFVLIGDGWVKDGDFNTSFSRTVLPLPTHADARYDVPPRRLEDDPVYRLHFQDFVDYHTRYVTSAPARDAIRLLMGPRRK